MMSERINMMVEDGTAQKLESLAGGKRQMGAWLSAQVAAMHGGDQVAGNELYDIRLYVSGLAGTVKQLDARLARLEAMQT